MTGWFIALIVFIVLIVLGVALWLWNDETTDNVNNRVSKALQWWSQTDERLMQLGKGTASTLLGEIEELLRYPEYLFDETRERLENLRTRLRKVKGKL